MLAPNAMSRAPSLSVIVINARRDAHLPACLEGLRAQRSVALELLLADCGGDDASPDRLERHRATVDHLITGAASTAEAANRALASARGEWALMLRPDDRLVGDLVLSECLNWMRTTEAGVVAGEVACNDGRILKLRSQPNAIGGEFLPDSGTFYRRTLFDEHDRFDTSLQYMARYDLHLRLWKGRVRFKPIPLRVVATEGRGLPPWSAAREEIRVRHRYFGRARSLRSDLVTLLRRALRRPGPPAA